MIISLRINPLTLEEFLFELSLCDLNLYSLIDLLGVALPVVRVVLDCGGEQSVDKGGLAKSRFASDLARILVYVAYV